jgi:hypothetical protein
MRAAAGTLACAGFAIAAAAEMSESVENRTAGPSQGLGIKSGRATGNSARLLLGFRRGRLGDSFGEGFLF